MGFYINPKTESKEDFLKREGRLITENEMLTKKFDEKEYVCVLLNNGFFSAGLICYCDNELDYIQRNTENETRPVTYYMVDSSLLQEFIGE